MEKAIFLTYLSTTKLLSIFCGQLNILAVKKFKMVVVQNRLSITTSDTIIMTGQAYYWAFCTCLSGHSVIKTGIHDIIRIIKK